MKRYERQKYNYQSDIVIGHKNMAEKIVNYSKNGWQLKFVIPMDYKNTYHLIFEQECTN